MKKKSLVYAGILFMFFTLRAYSQLTVTTGQTPTWYVENVLLSGGVTVSNVTYTGTANAMGQFSTGINPTNLGLNEGLVISTGLVNGTPAIGAPVGSFASTSNNQPGSPLLNALIPGYSTNDAAILSFNFIPLSDTIRFRYVFGSEEYPEWVGSSYNDVFGFFVTGPNPLGGNYNNYNIARIPSTTIPVAINNINSGSYAQYYVNNQGLGGQTIVFDGFTTVLTAWCKVTPCVNYSIKIAIADAGDYVYDSAVFLEANSFGTNAFNVNVEYTVPGGSNFAIEGCADALVHFSLPSPMGSNFIMHYTIAGSAVNGVDYLLIPDSIVIPAGQQITTLPISPIFDGMVEPMEDILLIFTNTCGVTDTIKVNIRDYVIPSCTASGATSFCESAASLVQLNANVNDGYPPFVYNWDNGAGGGQNPIVTPTTTTTYTVTMTDLCGYEANASVTVTVYPDPVLTITANPPGLCAGQSSVLTASGADLYNWINIGNPSNPVTVTPTSTTTYILLGTTNNGCFAIDSITVPVNPSPSVDFYGIPTEGCIPLNVQFTEDSPDTDITNWLWTFGNGQTSTSQNPSYSYNSPGNFDVSLTLTNSYNCVSVLSKPSYISAWPQPVADFYTIPEIGKTYDPTIYFYSNTDSQYWLWYFGDGDSSEFPPVIYHTYPSTEGTYQVTLFVYNDSGCNDTITKMIIIIDDVLEFPNIITPNGDGRNDYLVIKNAEKYPNNLIQIFNRWGKKIYEQQNYDNAWNGANHSDGTYYYIFYYLDKIQKSSLTILRE